MSEKTQGSYITRIATLSDNADINTAFKFYHYGLDPVTGSADSESVVGHFTAVNARVDASNVRITDVENAVTTLEETIGPSLAGTYIARVSATSNPNVITPQVSSVVPLVIAGVTGQSVNLQEWKDAVSGNIIAKVDSTGKLFSNNVEVVSLTATQTMTNKTLTSPTINSGTINSTSINSPTLTGGTIAGSITNTATISGGIFTNSNIRLSISTPTIVANAYALATDLSDAGKLLQINNASTTTFTIPNDTTANYAIGTQIAVIQTGAGQVVFAGAGGVTVNAAPGLKIRSQWSSATLVKTAANTWIALGSLTA